jgi:putative acetyltransferase
MLIRRETPDDRAPIFAVHTEAFRPRSGPDPGEARLVDELRADGDLIPALSLVAIRDGELVGHICCSPAKLGEDADAAIGLGPLGVLPGYQRTGVGSALVHATLAAADALGYGLVVLLGDPGYYSRFGFVLASALAITPAEPGWTRHFQARPLTGYLPTQAGAFTYSPAFARI